MLHCANLIMDNTHGLLTPAGRCLTNMKTGHSRGFRFYAGSDHTRTDQNKPGASDVAADATTQFVNLYSETLTFVLNLYSLQLDIEMTDPVSAASGILTLVVFAFQSSKILYETISSFQSSQRTIRELKEGLVALNEVLESLQQTVATTDVDFSSLELPLRRCGKACEDFNNVIDQCTKHSGGSRTSFRDWAKLKYMGNDITGFKNMLASYKSTIIIALGDANV